MRVAAELGKPLVLEEFGKVAGEGNITSVRDPWFNLVNDAVDASLAVGGPLRGALFWQVRAGGARGCGRQRGRAGGGGALCSTSRCLAARTSPC